MCKASYFQIVLYILVKLGHDILCLSTYSLVQAEQNRVIVQEDILLRISFIIRT